MARKRPVPSPPSASGGAAAPSSSVEGPAAVTTEAALEDLDDAALPTTTTKKTKKAKTSRGGPATAVAPSSTRTIAYKEIKEVKHVTAPTKSSAAARKGPPPSTTSRHAGQGVQSDDGSDDSDDDDFKSEEEQEQQSSSSDVDGSSDSDSDDDDGDGRPTTTSHNKAAPTAVTAATTTANTTNFLDAFYGLASDDAHERATAGYDVIQHCLIVKGSSDNTAGVADAAVVKDASYALTRLIKGLGSGRAAARQGNAAALTVFLRVSASARATTSTLLDLIVRHEQHQQNDASGDAQEELNVPAAEHVYRRLRTVMAIPDDSNSKSKAKKGKKSSSNSPHSMASASDERDAKLGLLFGILAIIRSGILFIGSSSDNNNNNNNNTNQQQLICDVGRDLMRLYNDARITYVRGPAAHAVVALLWASSSHPAVLKALVEHVVVPELATRINAKDGDDACTIDDAAMVLVAQTIYLEKSIPFPTATSSPASFLGRSLLTKDRLALLAPQLVEALGRQQDAQHLPLFLEAVIRYMTVPVHADSTKSNKSEDSQGRRPSEDCEKRTLRASKPFMDDGAEPSGLLNALWRHATASPSEAESKSRKKNKDASHDDQLHTAFLMLFRIVVAGIEYTSSSGITGRRTRVTLKADDLERCLSSRPSGMVEALLHGLASPSASPELRSLAIETVSDVEAKFNNSGSGKDRLAIVKTLLQHDPAFDAKTKTQLVAHLVRVDDQFDVATDPTFLDGLLDFLVRQIALVKDADDMDVSEKSNSSPIMPSQAVGYLDLLLKLARTLLSDATKPISVDLVQRFTGMLLLIAYFDCSGVTNTSSRKDGKHKKSSKHTADAVRRFAVAIKESRAGSSAVLPSPVRETASSRFYSIVSLFVARSFRPTSPQKGAAMSDRGGSATDLLSAIAFDISSLQEAGATLINQVASRDGDDDEDDSDPNAILTWLRKHVDKASGSVEEEKRCFSGFYLLGATLYLAVLQPREDDEAMMTGPSPVEVATELLVELKQCYKRFVKPKDECSLSLLSSLLIDALSSPLLTSSSSNGAYPTLLKDVARHTWISALALCDSDPARYCKDPDVVVNGLLDSIGAADDADGDPDHVDESEEEEDDDDSDDDDSHHDLPVPLRNGKGKKNVKIDEQEGSDSDGDASDEEEEILEAGALQTFLEDDEMSVEDLEHHEGADAALATFIKAKQDARKAGQAVKQRVEIENQFRCTALLEALLVCKDPTRRGHVVSGDRCIRILVSLVLLRKRLEKSVEDKSSSSSGGGGGSSSASLVAEKRKLMDRVTVLLRTRLIRSKLLTSKWDDDSTTTRPPVQELVSQCCTRLLIEIKGRASKEQRSCCHLAMMSILRSVPDVSSRLECASNVYKDVVVDWTTKRTSRLDASLLDELIEHDPPLAQAVLTGPLSQAVSSSSSSSLAARTPFLKLECFRLIGKLYKTGKGSTTTTSSGGDNDGSGAAENKSDVLKRRAVLALRESSLIVVEAYCACLTNDPNTTTSAVDMLKSKRLRELLKSLDVFVQSSTSLLMVLQSSSSSSSDPQKQQLRTLQALLQERRQDSDSPVVKSMCDRIAAKLPRSSP